MRARRLRFALAVVSTVVVIAAAAGTVGADWTVRCPESGAVGWMDCAGQRDAVYRSETLPGWVDPDLLLAAGLVGLAGLALAAVLERRSRRAGLS